MSFPSDADPTMPTDAASAEKSSAGKLPDWKIDYLLRDIEKKIGARTVQCQTVVGQETGRLR